MVVARSVTDDDQGEGKDDENSQKEVAKKQKALLSSSTDVKVNQGNSAMTSQNLRDVHASIEMYATCAQRVCTLSKFIVVIANLGCPPAYLLSKIAVDLNEPLSFLFLVQQYFRIPANGTFVPLICHKTLAGRCFFGILC